LDPYSWKSHNITITKISMQIFSTEFGLLVIHITFSQITSLLNIVNWLQQVSGSSLITLTQFTDMKDSHMYNHQLSSTTHLKTGKFQATTLCVHTSLFSSFDVQYCVASCQTIQLCLNEIKLTARNWKFIH